MSDQAELASMKCVPCRGGVPPLTDAEQSSYLKGLKGWQIVRSHHLHKNFDFPTFKAAVAWVNAVADLAESEGHHPDIHLSFRKAGIDIWTHKIDGMTVSDFVLAAKIDALPSTPQSKE